MKRLICTVAAMLVTTAAAASPAGAAEYEKYAIESGAAILSSSQAGDHADFTASLELSSKEGNAFAKTRDVIVKLPPGIFGNPEAFPKCTNAQFGFEPEESACPIDSQVGSVDIAVSGFLKGTFPGEPIYNMPAPGGDVVARFGFFAALFPTFIDVSLNPDTNGLVASVEGSPSAVELVRADTTFWGVPAHPSHDLERITPFESREGITPPGGRPSGMPEIPFMTNPTSCRDGREVRFTARSYQLPEPRSLTVPFPQIASCDMLEFSPETSLKPTTGQASAASGLNYGFSLPTKGLEFSNVRYGSELRRARVTLPEGMTLNPSAAEGLGVCSQADLDRERFDSGPDVGCPESSKLGSAVAKTPVIDREAVGSLYLAKPYENPFGSLLALYLVMKVPDRGVLVKLAGRVEPDPRTGRLVTTFDDIPELPVANFELRFREGARAPLVTPPTCGSYEALSGLTPWSSTAAEVFRVNAFSIEGGPDRGPCPAGGVPPFEPGLLAYPLNGAAGAHSPLYMRLTRRDGDQGLTRFSATLPPGLVAKLAGTTQCSEAAIARARSRTGPREGRLELADPSCPASARIGRVLAGAGVGSVLTYAAGEVYLAGPYNGAPLSVVAIVPAVAGPFDVGTVVTRQALRLNPRTGIVTVDGASSDPIPHILAGIPLKVRDIRVYVDRPDFTLNPTSCEPFSIDATLWGGGTDVFGSADDLPFGASDRFQAADCAALGFSPRLSLSLEGGTKRGGHPALRGVFRPRPGDSNLEKLVLRLPRSAFLEQAHIRTICTRVQFAANGGNGRGCPAGSIYGHVRAYTPILDQPLEGPVFLRASNNPLPDFVAALRGLVDVEAVAKIDSVGGGIRATFTEVPDAPLSKVVVEMQGQKKGLIVNSADLCRAANRANAAYSAHNDRRAQGRPALRAEGCGKGARKRNGPR